jgi:hypothetical protein
MTTKKPLSKLERVPLHEAWKHEASDFTPWLAEIENLNTLADALGLSELALVGTEYWVGDFKLDILCTDGEEKVIIENQLEETDHKHLGQIITYAAGVGAKKVIWIAKSFRPEYAAALQFLNDNTTEDLSFFGVEVGLCRIEDSPLAPVFDIVVKPDEWVRIGREQARAAASMTPTKQLQLEFWNALVKRLSEKAPQIKTENPRPRSWLNINIGKTGFGLNPTVNSKEKHLGVELYISGPKAKGYFAKLSEQKKEIENKLGFELDWQQLPESIASRIASWYSEASIEDENRWDEYLDWLTQRLVKMYEVFPPIVKALP